MSSSAGMMLLLLCAICSAFCCSWCVLSGGGPALNGPESYFKRGKFALGFTNVALLGAFATGAIGILKSDARMAYASGGLITLSLLVPWLIVDRSTIILYYGDGVTQSVSRNLRRKKRSPDA